MNRRDFLKFTGLFVVGATAPQLVRILSGDDFKGSQKNRHRWAMAISFSACVKKQNCTDCIDACHTVHNVPVFDNPKDEVKWIWTSQFDVAFGEQTNLFTKNMLKNLPVLCMCNHCENPPCVKVCPTKATWKREDGIVMIDYHRCIGCRYCMAACPYGARSFNWRDPKPFIKNINHGFPRRTMGVVEKCNFCEERISEGLLPACVEACSEKALIFGDINDPDSEIYKTLRMRLAIQRKPHLGTEPRVFYLF